MLQADFLSLTFEVKIFAVFSFKNNTPNPLDLESWNVIDLNSLFLGPCSVRANVLVFLFEL